LASVLERKRDYEGAITEYEYMLKQDPGSLIVANNLASLLADNRTDKASIERAYSLAPILRKSPVPAFQRYPWLDLSSVNAVSIFLTCAEVKFPRRRVTVISRRCDQGLHFCVGARGGAAAVPGSAS
jgi:hypothetical protein